MLKASTYSSTGLRLTLLMGLGLLAALLLLAACSSRPTSFVEMSRRGDTLWLTLSELESTPEVRYAVGEDAHFLLKPSSPENELVMVRLFIQNAEAVNVVFTIDSQVVELRSTEGGEVFSPIDVNERAIAVDQGDPSESKFARRFSSCPTTFPCVMFMQGPANLPQGFGFGTWMVFEVPKGTELRGLRWDAGDTIIMNF